jgi:hypothetical protein
MSFKITDKDGNDVALGEQTEMIEITNKSSVDFDIELLTEYMIELNDGKTLRLYEADKVDSIFKDLK